MAEHCCRTMHNQVAEDSHLPEADRLIHHDAAAQTYALSVRSDPYRPTVPIAFCPWCGTRLRQVRAQGLRRLSPEACRAARNAVGLTQRQLADAVGEELATIFHYEMGKPTDEAVVEKLLFFFQEHPIAVTRSGRITRYVT